MSVDSGTRSRLLWGFIAQGVSKFSQTVITLAQVPIFLTHWSEPVYGEWMYDQRAAQLPAVFEPGLLHRRRQ